MYENDVADEPGRDQPGFGVSSKGRRKGRTKAAGPSYAKLLRPPPVLKGENKRTYQAIFDAVQEEMNPRGFLGALFVQDVAAHQHELDRARAIKASLLNSIQVGALDGERELLAALLLVDQVADRVLNSRNRALREFVHHRLHEGSEYGFRYGPKLLQRPDDFEDEGKEG